MSHIPSAVLTACMDFYLLRYDGAMSYDSKEFRLDSTDSSDRLLVYSKLSCCFKADNNKAIIHELFIVV